MNQARNFEDVFVNVIASDHCLTRKEDSVIVVATWLVASSSSASILTVTDLGGARFAHVKEEAWQSFGKGALERLAFCKN